ncbi:hypothetical protein ASE00_02680 [Sphingomonas sp. Root710]|uniref:hypothetical protein n=1 Tax=Sphingomonas sp. Root710 TaxID=1736594 RepID=UPI0006F20606|nr:hypothetical protein [Sphingomonas sp. Root710]KRB85700.1 hypothetical protein ASE00_02680 [Sphingomonas sp. Root710]
MDPDILDLRGPPAAVHPQRLVAPVRGYPVETGFGDGEIRPLPARLQAELDEGRFLLRIISRGVDGIGVLGEGKAVRRFEHDRPRRPADMLISLMGDVSAAQLADQEWPIEGNPKPLPEFAMVGHCPPDALDRRVELDFTLDHIGHIGTLRGEFLGPPGRYATISLLF